MTRAFRHVNHPWRGRATDRGGLGIGGGDRGQRYEVRYQDGKNEQHIAGWAGTPESAQKFVEAINRHSTWHSPEVVDRQKTKAVS